jgi:hypothetical protein
MSPGPTFDRVYLALKEQLTSGRFGPGEHLEPAALGEELNASITPVRDALHRLVGERIVEAPRNDGFRVPAPTEAELRDLYGWNRQLLELACRRAPGRGVPPSPLPAGEGTVTTSSSLSADLFRRIAALSGSSENEAAVEILNDRLGAPRAYEERLFQDWFEELDGMREAYARGDLGALRRGIAAYHRRRQRSVPELLVEWRRFAVV